MKIRAAIWQSTRIVVAAVIAFSVCYFFHFSEGYWIVISALLASQISPNLLLRQKISVLIFTGIIAASLALVTNTFASYAFFLAFLLFVSTFFTIYIGALYTLLWGATFVTNFFAVSSAGLLISIDGRTERFFCILLGFVIAIVLQIIIFPVRAVPEAKSALADCLNALSRLTETFFDCYIARDYIEKHFYYEKKLHENRRDVLHSMNQARRFILAIKQPNQQKFSALLEQIEHMYEIVLALGGLLYRVSDPATFEVSCKEYSVISEKIVSNLRLMARCVEGRREVTYSSLVGSIEQFEEVYRSALQIVSRDPMVFMLFIQDLYGLDDVMMGFAMGLERSATG